MSPGIVLFLLYNTLATVLCLWAALSALQQSGSEDGAHRSFAFAIGLLLPVSTLATPVGAWLDLPWLPLLGLPLPLFALVAVWINLATLRGGGFTAALLHLPLIGWNSLLAGLYGLHLLSDLGLLDLGTAGGGLLSAHASLQTMIGGPGALDRPHWFYLPVLLPLWRDVRWAERALLLGAGGATAALFAIFATMLPRSFERVRGYRDTSALEAFARTEALPIGIGVPWGRRVLPDATLRRHNAALASLEPQHVAIEVTAETFADPALLAQVRQQLAHARDHGIETVVTTAIPSEFRRVPARDLRELSTSMAQVQWLAAERLQPDLMYLFVGPFGRMTEHIVQRATIAEWFETISQCADDARRAFPNIRVAIALESRAPHAAELLAALRVADSPVDCVGLSVRAGRGTFRDAGADLARLERLCATGPQARPVTLIAAGACPRTVGGELGQWNFLCAALTVGQRMGCIQATLANLTDDHRIMDGLIGRTGKRRRAFHELAAATRAAAPTGR